MVEISEEQLERLFIRYVDPLAVKIAAEALAREIEKDVLQGLSGKDG